MDDFDRNVWCLLGLVFDAMGLDDAIDAIHKAAGANRPLEAVPVAECLLQKRSTIVT